MPKGREKATVDVSRPSRVQMIAHGDPPQYLTFPGLRALGLPHATTTRHCPGIVAFGDAGHPFLREAAVALSSAGLDLTAAAYARQMHGADVAHAPPRGGFAGPADILVTTERRAPLAIFTADCLAITLVDPDVRALAVAHVGWRGTMRGAAQAAVAALATLGARPERLRATIGPSIGPCCYEVDRPVASSLASAYPKHHEQWLRPVGDDRWMFDLWTANESLLALAGVDPAHIENPRLCTGCQTQLFFSYRKGNRGRLVTFAALS